MGEHGVINTPADDPGRSRCFEGMRILIAVQGNNQGAHGYSQ